MFHNVTKIVISVTYKITHRTVDNTVLTIGRSSWYPMNGASRRCQVTAANAELYALILPFWYATLDSVSLQYGHFVAQTINARSEAVRRIYVKERVG
jgi:hypothetical protein